MRLLRMNPRRMSFLYGMLIALAIVAIVVNVDKKKLRFGTHSQLTFEEMLQFYGNHSSLVVNYFQLRENITMSVLGDILFKDMPPPEPLNKTFKILLWRCGPHLENRHIKRYSQQRFDPFEECLANNCKITTEESELESSDAVLFHLHRLKGPTDLPDPKRNRSASQRWVFITDESPYNTFMVSKDHWSEYNGIFNWSMNYKMESDVPVPYGRTVPLSGPNMGDIADLVPYANEKQRKVLVAALISNCGKQNHRLQYIRELQKYMDIDLYGACGVNLRYACPGGFKVDCPLLNKYHFYLAFENSNCEQYITEKVFWNGFHKGAIPVIMGTKNVTCKKILPPDSFIHVDNYARPADMARHLLYVNKTWGQRFFMYHEWRRHFRALNEHGYFGSRSRHYCRICEALNFNKPKPYVYYNLEPFLGVDLNCR